MSDACRTTADGVVVSHGDIVWDQNGLARSVRSSKELLGQQDNWDAWVAASWGNEMPTDISFTYSTEKAALLARRRALVYQAQEIGKQQIAVATRLAEIEAEES